MFWKLFDYINLNLASVFYNPMFRGQVLHFPNNNQEVFKALKSALLVRYARHQGSGTYGLCGSFLESRSWAYFWPVM